MTKILITEDDPLMAEMYRRIFQLKGYQVLLADTGYKCLELAKSAAPDLILLDLLLPMMSGLEVLDALKSDKSTRDIPVVILTNLAEQQEASAALSKGAVKFIVKSEYDARQVAEMVKEVLA